MEENNLRERFAEYIKQVASLRDSTQFPENFSPIAVDVEKIKLKGDE